MSDCINCQCEDIVVGRTACNSLKKQNDDRIKLHPCVIFLNRHLRLSILSGVLIKILLVSFVG